VLSSSSRKRLAPETTTRMTNQEKKPTENGPALGGACACEQAGAVENKEELLQGYLEYTPSFSSAWWLRDVYVIAVARQADSNSSISEQTF
jgi:hypothetical protein